MATRRDRTIMTYDDYARLPDDGKRYELFEGELLMAAAPNLAHQRVVVRLSGILDRWVRPRRLGEIFVAPCDVVLSPHTVLQPDIFFVSRERAAILRSENVQGAPDLVVEVISPSSAERDREIKRDLYAGYGVPYYWLVDPHQRIIEAYQLVEDRYRLVGRAAGDEVLTAPPFPDLAIRSAELWD